MIAGAWRAELLKLRKRPAVWVLFAVLIGTFVLFGYLITYVFLVAEVAGPVPDPEQFVADLLPGRAVANAVSGLAGFGGAFGLILGVLATGSEYSWGTVKTMAIQRPTRAALGAGKVGALAVVTLVYAVAYLLTGLACALVIAALEGADATLPGAGDVVAGIGAGWLILSVWTVLGVLLAVAFRGTGLAIGIGLVWILVLEQLLLALPLPEGVSTAMRTTLIGSNTGSLSSAFGELAGAGFGPEPVAPGQAVVVLLTYLAVLAGLAGLVFQRREIT